MAENIQKCVVIENLSFFEKKNEKNDEWKQGIRNPDVVRDLVIIDGEMTP